MSTKRPYGVPYNKTGIFDVVVHKIFSIAIRLMTTNTEKNIVLLVNTLAVLFTYKYRIVILSHMILVITRQITFNELDIISLLALLDR